MHQANLLLEIPNSMYTGIHKSYRTYSIFIIIIEYPRKNLSEPQ